MEIDSSKTNAFLAKILSEIEKNLGKENYTVEELAQSIGLSRSMLHRKLIKLTGKSASDLITEARLAKAMEMLERTDFNASEVAYGVGFSSPSYFTKVFKKHFNILPGEVKKKNSPSTINSSDSQSPPYKELKNRKRKVVFIFIVLAILSIGGGILLSRNYLNSSHAERSIVILPFDNLNQDSAIQYIADGITEDILNDLFHISNLRVISRTTSKSFHERKMSATQIAKELNAQNVLEGSIRFDGKKIRVSVQLIDGIHDKHIWSENFDSDFNDYIGTQGDIALQLAKKLKVVLSDNELMEIKKGFTKNPQAYHYYLQARYLLHKSNTDQRSGFDMEGVMNCLKYFELAIGADSNFAEAYSGLANARFNLSAWGWLPVSEGALKAKILADKALKIDFSNAEAHAVLGSHYVWNLRNIEEGSKELHYSVELNPNFATSQQWLAQLLMITGPIEEARKHMDKVLELEPDFWVIQNLNAWIYYFEGKYQEGIEACKTANKLNPNFIENYWLFFLNYMKTGEGFKAVQNLQAIIRSHPGAGSLDKEVMNVYSETGINGVLLWMTNVNMHHPIPVEGLSGHPFFTAWWFALLGKEEESIFWLEKNMESNYRLYIYFNLIATCPDFDLLRDNPRFLKIIDQIGLTPYHHRLPI